MEDMYQEYRDIAAFLVIYINEAHPSDGLSADNDSARQIPNHRNYKQRCSAANRMLDETLMSIPCLVDDMNNSTDIAWRAWPDKVFVVNSTGILAIAGADGPYGFEPAMQETRKWLEQLRDTGEEPAVIPGKADDFATVLMGELHPDGPQDEYLEKVERARRAAQLKKSPQGNAAKSASDETTRSGDDAAPASKVVSAEDPDAASAKPVSRDEGANWVMWTVAGAAVLAMMIVLFKAIRR